MEIKDLVLLIMMPLMLIGIVVYTNWAPSITGAVIAKQEESNIIGTYSIMPSFKAKFDYNLEDYANIKNKLKKEVVDACKDTKYSEQCFKEKSKEIGWDCGLLDESVLYDFIDKFRDCTNLKEQDVVCKFSFGENEFINKIKGERTFEIKLSEWYGQIKAELLEGDKVLKAEFINQENLAYTDNKDESGKNVDFVTIRISYKSGKPSVQETYASTDKSPKIDLSRIFLLYKKGKTVNFIDKTVEATFRATPEDKIIDLPRVNGFKFCAKTGRMIYAFDNSDKQVKQREIVYKFAVTFPNPPIPPPIRVLSAEDKLKAEKSIVLKWNKIKQNDGSDFKDFDHYNIYCSKNSFLDKNKQISLESTKLAMAVKSNKDYDLWQVDLSTCGKEPIEENVEYYFTVTAVSKSKKESPAIKEASAKSLDDLAPGTLKIVLINSDNIREEKVSSACINLPIGKDNKPSNIWAGFFMPEKNEDEITNIATTERLTYFLHFSKQNYVTSNLDICERYKCVELDFVPKDIIDLDRKRIFDKNKEIDNPTNFFQEGQTYCFTIVAKDKNNNIIKTLNLPYKFVKPQQWLELEANPVVKGFFNDKGEINYP